MRRFGDFDDDGDIDLIIVHGKAGCTLYDNQRQGRMKAVTDETGHTTESVVQCGRGCRL